jgi:hypothetical protein
VAVVFAFPYPGKNCDPPRTWQEQTRAAIAEWKRAGVHVYLVPYLPRPSITAGAPSEKGTRLGPGALPPAGARAFYLSLQRRDPMTVTVLDGGTFIRDASGHYAWRMPCLPGGEPGCQDDDTVVVRTPGDDGLHFCADPNFGAEACPSEFQAGERRVAAAIAAQLFAHRAREAR